MNLLAFSLFLFVLVGRWLDFDFDFDSLPAPTERNEVLKDKNSGPWPAKRRRAALYRNMGLLCCISRQHPNYL
jgi:hypothetical protein